MSSFKIKCCVAEVAGSCAYKSSLNAMFQQTCPATPLRAEHIP